MNKTYRLLLKQSIGGPAVPAVKKGDKVRRGQLLGSPEGLGVPLHASVSGKISAVGEGYIDILADDNQSEDFEPIPKLDSIVETVRAAGICGMGGAGFPTYVKLGTDLDGGSIIVNAVECEPLLKHNIEQIITDPDKIYRGVLLAMQATGAARGIFAVKAKNKEAVAAFRKVIRADNISIAELPDIYPMGEERAIIREVMHTLLGVDQLPAAAGAVILNVETVSRITEAVELGRPCISKNLTVIGKLKSGVEPKVFMDVPIGARVGDLVEAAGGIDGNFGEIIMGGPFTGKSTSLDSPVVKTTGGLIVTREFITQKLPLGLQVCACGASEARMREIAEKMGATVVAARKCKQAQEVKGALKCENPGNCPGQAEKILELRKEGAKALLIGNCSDCTNTTMGVAPKLGMPVHHCTDHALMTVGHKLIRRLPINE